MERLKRDISKGVDPFIKIIRTVYRSAETSANVTIEQLKKQRGFLERIAHIGFAHTRIRMEKFDIDNVAAEWIRPFYGSIGNRVILYCHGGGYTCGELEYAGILGTKFASHTGLDVLTFAYRLAPENRYPAALEDALKVWDYLISKGVPAKRIILAGDSAGGNLALEMCLYFRKMRRPQPAALILFSPWTDMTATAPTYESEEKNDPIISKIYVQNAREAYLGEGINDFKNPDYSPLYADLTGLPPTLIQVGHAEVLRHDSEALAKKLKRCGTHVRLQVFQGGWHVFQQFPTSLARNAMFEVNRFLLYRFYGYRKKHKEKHKKWR